MCIIDRLQKAILLGVICISPGAKAAASHIDRVSTGIYCGHHAFHRPGRSQDFDT